MVGDIDRVEREGVVPRHAMRPEHYPRWSDSDRDVTAAVEMAGNAKYVARKELTHFGNNLRQELWDLLCVSKGETVKEESQLADVLAGNLGINEARVIRAILDKGGGPETVMRASWFGQWREIKDALIDTETLSLTYILNKALREHPEVYGETRDSFVELKKDMLTTLGVPIMKTVLQLAHDDGVLEAVSPIQMNEKGVCIDAGELPIVGLEVLPHDFVKLFQNETYIWEHEALSTVAAPKLLDITVFRIAERLGLTELLDDEKRKKVVTLMAKAIMGHGYKEYTREQTLEEINKPQTVTTNGVHITKLQKYGRTHFYVESLSHVQMREQLPQMGDEAVYRLGWEALFRLPIGDMADGVSTLALKKYGEQSSGVEIMRYEGGLWGFIKSGLFNSFEKNITEAPKFSKGEAVSKDVITIARPTAFFYEMARQCAEFYEAGRIQKEKHPERGGVDNEGFAKDFALETVGESNRPGMRHAMERLYKTFADYQQDLVILGQHSSRTEEERLSREAAYLLVKRKVLSGLGFVLSKCSELDFEEPDNRGAKEMAERVLSETFGVAQNRSSVVK